VEGGNTQHQDVKSHGKAKEMELGARSEAGGESF